MTDQTVKLPAGSTCPDVVYSLSVVTSAALCQTNVPKLCLSCKIVGLSDPNTSIQNLLQTNRNFFYFES